MSVEKRPVTAEVVKLLKHERHDRGMQLIAEPSRCLRRGDIHELVTTDEHRDAAGARIDRVGFLGFAEITSGGVVERGDHVFLGECRVGHVLGFDACHAPNHLNVLIAAETVLTGAAVGLSLGEPVRFEPGDVDIDLEAAQASASKIRASSSGQVS